MLFDHLFQYRISPRPITAGKRGFCTCVTDGWTNGRTDGRTDVSATKNICQRFVTKITPQITDAFPSMKRKYFSYGIIYCRVAVHHLA